MSVSDRRWSERTKFKELTALRYVPKHVLCKKLTFIALHDRKLDRFYGHHLTNVASNKP